MSFPSFVDTIPRPLAWQQLPSFSLSVCGTTPWQGGGPARTAYQPYGMLRVRSTRFSRTLGSLLSPPLCSRTLFSRTILVKSVRVSRPPANLPPTHPSRVFTSSSLLYVYPRVSPVCFPCVYVFSVRRPLSEPATFLVAVSLNQKSETRRRSPSKEIRLLVSSWKSKRSQQYGDSHVRGVFRGGPREKKGIRGRDEKAKKKIEGATRGRINNAAREERGGSAELYSQGITQ